MTTESSITPQKPTDAQSATSQKLEWETPQLTQINVEDTETGPSSAPVENNFCCLISM